MKIVKKGARILVVIVAAYCIIYLATSLIEVDKGEKRAFFGYKPVIVTTGSMVPAIQINSLLLVKGCDIHDIEIGDIIMYKSPDIDARIVHRVVEINEDLDGTRWVGTKGDANEVSDNIKIYDYMIAGKVVKTYNGMSKYIDKYVINGELDSVRLIQTIGLFIIILAVLDYVIRNSVRYIKYTIIAVKNGESYEKELRRNAEYVQRHGEYKDMYRGKDVKSIIKRVKLINGNREIEDAVENISDS